MKKSFFHYAIIVIIASMLPACGGGGDNDDGPRTTGGDTSSTGQVSFNVAVSDYQGSSGHNWSFLRGDELGIYAVESVGNLNLQEYGNYADNMRYQWDGSRFLSVGNSISKPLTKQLAYYAIYPYMSAAGRQMEFTVNSNQASAENLAKSDFCTAFAALTSSMNVTIALKHRMSRVCVKVLGDNLQGHVSKVVLKDVSLTLSSNMNTDSYVSSSNGKRGMVDMWCASEDKNTYYAVIPPQILPSNKVYMVSTVDGHEMNVEFNSDEILTSGVEKVLTIQRKPDSSSELIVFGGQINPWEKD